MLRLVQIERIFVTHLHGDHCFGLGSMLATINAAKQQLTDARQQHLRVYGPPGLTKLLHAYLVMTGLKDVITLPLTITEFVTDARLVVTLQLLMCCTSTLDRLPT